MRKVTTTERYDATGELIERTVVTEGNDAESAGSINADALRTKLWTVVAHICEQLGGVGTPNFAARLADEILPLFEAETKILTEEVVDAQVRWLKAERSRAVLQVKVKALADDLLNPRHVDGIYEWAVKPDRDHARGRIHAQRQIGEKLLALVEEIQGGEGK